MRLTVKNYKRAEWASEETDCFTASLYLDGRRIGTARNEGRGGADFYDFNSRADQEAFDSAVKEWVESVKDDPRHQIDGKCYADEESMVAEACANFRREREMKRALKGYETVIRIERPRGWQTKILTVSLPAGHDINKVISEEWEKGDEVFLYQGKGGVERHEMSGA